MSSSRTPEPATEIDSAPVVSPDAPDANAPSGVDDATDAAEKSPGALHAMLGLFMIWAALYVVAIAEGISNHQPPAQEQIIEAAAETPAAPPALPETETRP